LLAGLASGLVNTPSGGLVRAASSSLEKTLVPGKARVPIIGGSHPDTGVWAYDESVPGPEIRLRQGETLRVKVDNRLPQDTTVHWHGIRLPNAMDGAAYVTQPPIQPGDTFTYEFAPPDAGTFWYHPHIHSAEQVGRGLMGALIVEEANPPPSIATSPGYWVISG
jgi:FtsP/CotA-like multicopper oxidase with cupredoxin domain